jgi:hypothetical protein
MGVHFIIFIPCCFALQEYVTIIKPEFLPIGKDKLPYMEIPDNTHRKKLPLTETSYTDSEILMIFMVLTKHLEL